jgi:hypothetical protein
MLGDFGPAFSIDKSGETANDACSIRATLGGAVSIGGVALWNRTARSPKTRSLATGRS